MPSSRTSTASMPAVESAQPAMRTRPPRMPSLAGSSTHPMVLPQGGVAACAFVAWFGVVAAIAPAIIAYRRIVVAARFAVVTETTHAYRSPAAPQSLDPRTAHERGGRAAGGPGRR